MVATLVVGHLHLPALWQLIQINAFSPLEELEEAFTEIELIDHEGSSDHVQHTEESCHFPVVRWLLGRALDGSEETLHMRDRALDFLAVAWSRIVRLLLNLIRIHQRLDICSFCVLKEKHTHVVYNRANPCTIKSLPLADAFERLETLREGREDFVFDALVAPSGFFAELLGVDQEADAPADEILVLFRLMVQSVLL